MGQRLQTSTSKKTWSSQGGERLWLSMLVHTMEEVSRPELRKIPCDPQILTALRAQLAGPAAPHPYGASNFSLRN